MQVARNDDFRTMLRSRFQDVLAEAGCDEAGRGCLAGPVFAAAVVFPQKYRNRKLNDSKQLSAAARLQLRKEIEKEAIAFAVAQLSNVEIDSINILNASIYAMHQALEKIEGNFEFIIVDGNRFKPFKHYSHETIVEGDAKYLSIAAASILAKTYRDEWMIAAHERFPQYDWINNKGYGTLAHRTAIKSYGLCELHRRTFQLKEMQLEIFD
ncbi:MAG: ribonuclease HII [Chitinophagales bacterium]